MMETTDTSSSYFVTPLPVRYPQIQYVRAPFLYLKPLSKTSYGGVVDNVMVIDMEIHPII